MKGTDQQEFRLENLTCANCAMKFEKNIQALPDVTEANVNFGASKVRVIGPLTRNFDAPKLTFTPLTSGRA